MCLHAQGKTMLTPGCTSMYNIISHFQLLLTLTFITTIKLEFHGMHTLCTLSIVSGLCCSESAAVCYFNALHHLGLGFPAFLVIEPTVDMTISKLGEVKVSKDSQEIPEHWRRNQGGWGGWSPPKICESGAQPP